MTATTGTFQTYQAKGIREDLSNIISNISPVDTVFMNATGKTEASNTNFEWQIDVLTTAVTTNQQIEGDDISTLESVTPTVRVNNYTQISRKTVIVAGTQEVVNKAGRKSELAYQITKKTKELKRDMEAMLTNNIASTAGTASAARTTGSLRAWIATNDDMGSGGSSGGFTTPTVAAATDGTQRIFTETLLKNVLRNVFTSGGTPDTLMVGPFNKQVASGFTGNVTKMQDTTDKKLVAAIDIYKSDFGTVKIVPNRFQRERDAFVLTMDLWKVAWLRSIRMDELAKTGDAEKRLLIAEYGLQSINEAGSGCIADLTTS